MDFMANLNQNPYQIDNYREKSITKKAKNILFKLAFNFSVVDSGLKRYRKGFGL